VGMQMRGPGSLVVSFGGASLRLLVVTFWKSLNRILINSRGGTLSRGVRVPRAVFECIYIYKGFAGFFREITTAVVK